MPHTARAALRRATPIAVDERTVTDCLNLESEQDRSFETAWRNPGVAATRRGGLPGTIGHIAESVVEVLLAERGYVPLAHHPGPGRHGVDLVMLHLPSEMAFAVEVKGTLKSGLIPRLTRRELAQMSSAWVDKPDNPGMHNTSLRSEDVYGAVAVVNFADLELRVAFTSDFEAFEPVTDDDLTSPNRS